MANWYYYNNNGEKIGPIQTAALKMLAQQGIIARETIIENHTGRSVTAGSVNGLTFPEPVTPSAVPVLPGKPDALTVAPSVVPIPSVESNPFATSKPMESNPFTAALPGVRPVTPPKVRSPVSVWAACARFAAPLSLLFSLYFWFGRPLETQPFIYVAFRALIIAIPAPIVISLGIKALYDIQQKKLQGKKLLDMGRRFLRS